MYIMFVPVFRRPASVGVRHLAQSRLLGHCHHASSHAGYSANTGVDTLSRSLACYTVASVVWEGSGAPTRTTDRASLNDQQSNVGAPVQFVLTRNLVKIEQWAQLSWLS